MLGVIAVALSVLSDGFGLIDRIRGDPPKPPSAHEGELKLQHVTKYATFQEWLEELRPSRSQREIRRVLARHYSPAQLDVIGTMVALEVRLEGYYRRRVAIRWSLLDRTRRPAGGPNYADREGWTVQPDAVRHGGILPVWIPAVPRDGVYRLRFGLYDGAGVELDRVETPPFDALAAEHL